MLEVRDQYGDGGRGFDIMAACANVNSELLQIS